MAGFNKLRRNLYIDPYQTIWTLRKTFVDFIGPSFFAFVCFQKGARFLKTLIHNCFDPFFGSLTYPIYLQNNFLFLQQPKDNKI